MSLVLPDPWQMSNLTSRFYECLDSRNYEGVIECFSDDGIWFRRGGHVAGHAAIRRALAERPADFHTGHLVTNVRVEQISENEGHVLFCMSGYPYHGAIHPGTYVAQPAAHIVADYRDTMRKINGRWVITEKKNVRTAFKDAQHLP